MMKWISLTLLGLACLTQASCNGHQRDLALQSVRQLQSTGVAFAATAPGLPQQAPSPGTPPPGGPPPGTAPGAGKPGGPPPPPPAGKAGDKADAAGKAKTPDEIIDDFVKSDPRNILDEKSKDLKGRETKPWDEESPETFIPETGRKDPMTVIIDAVPKELLPKRSGDDSESELQTYLYTELATEVMNGVARSLQCHSVITIGLTKYAQMSFSSGSGGQGGQGGRGGRRGGGNGGGGGTSSEGRFIVTEGASFTQAVGGMLLTVEISSISSKEVDVHVTVAAPRTNISVEKDLVYIPSF